MAHKSRTIRTLNAVRILIGLLAIATFYRVGAVERLPLESFAQLESINDVAISPDGHYVAVISSLNHKRAALIWERSNGLRPTASLGNDKHDNFDIDWCRWANSKRILCGYFATATEMGVYFPVTRLVAMDADGKNIKVLIQNSELGVSQFQSNVIDWSPGIQDTVLVQAVKQYEPDGYPSVFELNIRTGAMHIHTRARGPIRQFITDGHGQVRMGSGYSGKKISYFARLNGEHDWRLLARFEAFSQADSVLDPFAVVSQSNLLYASGSAGGRDALWKFDLEDKEDPSLVFSHPLVDVNHPVRSKDGRMIGVIYHTEEPHAYYLDPYFQSVDAALRTRFPDTFNYIRDMTEDQKTFVVDSFSDVEAGRWVIYDSVKGSLEPLGRAYPDLPAEKMARLRWIHYPAKDGTTIPGYLTIPKDAKPEKLPLIVMPHGGPIHRDTFEFDFLRQFLANRGYAVLQMNFRGSSGYGAKWLRDAHQDWGGLTYSDITDGARWAIAQGIADPNRVCILGWSFGGYAALLGAVRNSDLYRCSVSIAGVSDLRELLFDEKNFANSAIAALQIGTDSDKLKNDSPRLHAAEINIPVLLIHGDRDFQVYPHHSSDMAKALKRAGKKYQYVEIDGGTHQLWREVERITLLQSVEKFLAENLGAP